MGRWFARFLKQEGVDVVISGRDEAKLRRVGEELGVKTASSVAATRSAEVIIVSVSIESFEDVLREIGPHVTAGQTVIDFTSIKVAPVAAMHRYIRSGKVLGAHPLFGPGAKSFLNQNFILTPTTTEESVLAGKVSGYLEARGARVSTMSPEEHDEMMTIILGLAHFIAIVSADTLISSGRMKKVESFGGITYKVLLTLVESVLTEDPALYASLQTGLSGTREIEKLFVDTAGQWAELVAGKNRAEFVGRMQVLKQKLEQISPDFGMSYENRYKIAELL